MQANLLRRGRVLCLHGSEEGASGIGSKFADVTHQAKQVGRQAIYCKFHQFQSRVEKMGCSITLVMQMSLERNE